MDPHSPTPLPSAPAARYATEQLLPEVYYELRRLAEAKLLEERPGQTLQATALVHDAFLRLAGNGSRLEWNSPGHFFGAASEAMRRILVENARRKQTVKRGGKMVRQELAMSQVAADQGCDDVLALDEALDRLAEADPLAADLVKLRFFSGVSSHEAAGMLEISPRKADMVWAYARAWLRRELSTD